MPPVALLLLQLAQNPSPMVEHTREHPRLEKRDPPGRRVAMPLGRLFLPARWRAKAGGELLIHFHGAEWIAEVAAERLRVPVIAVQAGAGSSRYAAPLRAKPTLFADLLREAETAAGARFGRITLSSWSAGYGAIREVLRSGADPRVWRIVAVDSIHAGYGDSGPPAAGVDRALPAEDLAPFDAFAHEALRGRKRFLLAHSEIYPGTFASTTETSDWLLARLGLRRRAVVRWGPMRTQMLSDTRRGGVRVLGFAGNSAPDHVDLLHALPELIRMSR